MKKKCLLAALLAQIGAVPVALAQPQTGVFTLGEIKISAPGSDAAPTGSVVLEGETLREQNRETVGSALDLAPGVSLGYAGARGEQVVYVRGFDRLQVPVYVDGIPTYIPYDGRIDLAHFTTFDLSRIEIAKGFSSLIYGPNALGGAINLITRRPVKAFEGEVGMGIGLSDGGRMNNHRVYTNLGGKQENWWYQVGVSQLKTNSFDLPDSFRPRNVQQGEGRRLNSARQDDKLSFKIGLTPNASDEYVFGYLDQRGEKGQPTYAGTLPLTGSGSGMRARWWQWPQWDKTSTYFTSSTRVGEHVLRSRVYHDTFKNTLVGHTYTNGVVRGVATGFPSRYDDDSTGLSVEGDFRLGSQNRLQVAYHLKDDVHRSIDPGKPWTFFKDRTQSLALENTYAINDRLSLVGGVSHTTRKSLATRNFGTNAASPTVATLYNEPGGDDSAANAQIGLFQKVGTDGQVRVTLADKSRFATMMERYSTRFGTVIPNPDLKAERALHHEIGYSGPLAGTGWLIDTAVFHSEVRNSIQTVRIPQQAGCNNATCDQPQNVAKARNTGLEVGLQGDVGPVGISGNYTLLQRKNLSAPAVRPTDTPSHKLFLTANWKINAAWDLGASGEATSERLSSSDGSQVARGYAVYHLKAGYRFANHMRVEAGVRNLFDRLYEHSEGYPMAGRNYFVNLNVPF
ncbi:TonB-dependent receptor plug domain-containing protein [Hydrogenophaga palleronii]|uniref:TonB-dependent receptor plug domain-containing protein n=1 Tax=Hydrogenophaga palleronii TaxID=65655 RepID=UPI0008256EAC|nr:TonB-dependent receptor [Hydrogenophaga palleronii]